MSLINNSGFEVPGEKLCAFLNFQMANVVPCMKLQFSLRRSLKMSGVIQCLICGLYILLYNNHITKGVFTPKAKLFFHATESHKVSVQTRVAAIYAIFSRAARIGRLGRRDVGDAFTAERFQRHNFRPELKYFNFEAVISQLGPISSCVPLLCSALVALEAEVFQT